MDDVLYVKKTMFVDRITTSKTYGRYKDTCSLKSNVSDRDNHYTRNNIAQRNYIFLILNFTID